MKKLLFLVFLISIIGCKHDSIIDKNVKEYVRNNFHNPDSYQPVSMNCMDTITNEKNLKSEIVAWYELMRRDSLKIKQDSIEIEKNKLFSTIEIFKQSLKSDKENFQIELDNCKMDEQKLDSLNKSADPKSILKYSFIHRFRAIVPLGGLMLKSASIETDKDFNIIKFVEINN